MNSSALIFLFITLTLWTDTAQSKGIKYDELRTLVVNSNEKVHSLEYRNESVRLKTGYLGRSFIPDVTLFAGQESFESQPLGAQNTNFYGVNAKANIFRGMSDYWEEERMDTKYQFQKMESAKSLNDIVFAAQESYLRIANMKLMVLALTQGTAQLNHVRSKVTKKIKSGVSAKSDLTSISLVKVGFEEKIRQINRSLVKETNKLSVLLGMDNITSTSIDESVMNRNLSVEKNSTKKQILELQMIDAQVKMKQEAAKSASSKRLPSLDLFANYARVPFSSREFINGEDRLEFQAGIQATWKIGDFFENSREASSFRAESAHLQKLKSYNRKKLEGGISAMKINLHSLLDSIKGISSEVGLSKNYYKQVSSEYLRGVKSTSDLTTAFNQLLDLKQQRLNLIVEFYLSKAEVDRLTRAAK